MLTFNSKRCSELELEIDVVNSFLPFRVLKEKEGII